MKLTIDVHVNYFPKIQLNISLISHLRNKLPYGTFSWDFLTEILYSIFVLFSWSKYASVSRD